MRRRDQRIDRQQTQRRRTVDHDVREVFTQAVEAILQPEMRVQLAYQLGFELRQADARRHDRQVRLLRLDDDVLDGAGRVDEGVVDTALYATDVHVGHRAVALRVEVDEESRLAAEGEGRREVDGGRGFADSAFLICNRNNHVRGATLTGL